MKNTIIGRKVCDICGEDEASLAAHKKYHHEVPSMEHANVACLVCGKSYPNEVSLSRLSLSRLILNVHEKAPCTICGEMVALNKANRHYHQKHTSNNEKKFKCKFCSKAFIESWRLRDHVNTHTGEKPYTCKFCGSAFASRGNQRMHERGHMGHKRSK